MPKSIEEEAQQAIKELEKGDNSATSDTLLNKDMPVEDTTPEEESVLTEEEQIINDEYLKDYSIPEEENAS